ncbi:MAG: flippase-like domain-containing protein [Muribaculaceae bacterium]|nr:flippase-like domain-containing protein [Muribaculaceae bacterium]
MKTDSGLIAKIFIPVAIGLGVVVWLFAREFDIDTLSLIRWNVRTVAGIALAWVAMAGREAGLAWRFRVLTDRQLSWRQALKVTMLCEFTSAVTPTTAGGSAVSMVFMKREGIAYGRGTTLTMSTLFLDELFYVVACPLMFLLIPGNEIFGFAPGTVGAGIRTAFWIVYGGICLVTVLLYIGIFVSPGAVGRLFMWVTSLRWLKKWRKDAEELRVAMVDTGRDIKSRPMSWWLEAGGATVMTWVSRYLVVNALFWGIVATASQAVVFGRQFVVWTLLTVSPTPGGSGVSEWLFTTYYGDLIGDVSLALVIAVFWRIITYYIYLAIGAIILPSWLRNSKKSHRK